MTEGFLKPNAKTAFFKAILKPNLHDTRDITSKRVTSGGVHRRDLTLGQHSSKETSQR